MICEVYVELYNKAVHSAFKKWSIHATFLYFIEQNH